LCLARLAPSPEHIQDIKHAGDGHRLETIIVVFFIYRPGKYAKTTELKDGVVPPSLASPSVAGKYAQMQSPTGELKRDEDLATP
jgi:hypothetical protein